MFNGHFLWLLLTLPKKERGILKAWNYKTKMFDYFVYFFNTYQVLLFLLTFRNKCMGGRN